MLKYRTHILLSLFATAFGKSLIFSPSFQDASVILILGVVFAYSEYKNSEKKLQELEVIVKQQQEIVEDLKEKVASIKITQQMRPGSVGIR